MNKESNRMQDNITRYSEKDIDNILINALGEKYSEYRNLWNNSSYTNIPKFPVHIDFELNDFCNQSCIMCPRNSKKHPDINYTFNSKDKFEFQTFKQIIDEGVLEGLQSINLGAFAEPLLNENTFKMIKYASSKGIVDTRLITNGLLLEKNIDNIFESKLVNLFVSIDAYSEEQYFKIRGNGFERVKNSLEKLLKERTLRGSVLPIIRVSFVDMDTNKHEKEQFIEYWKKKVDFIDIQVFDDYNVDIKKEFDFSKKKKWDCYSPFARLAILSNGNILPCCNFFGRNIPIGNIHKSSIKQIWNSKKINDIRDGIVNDTNRNCSICQRI